MRKQDTIEPALDEAAHHRADLIGDTEETTAQARRFLPEAFLDKTDPRNTGRWL